MNGQSKYPFADLRVGERLEMKPADWQSEHLPRIKVSACAHARRYGKKFHFVSVPGGFWVEREA